MRTTAMQQLIAKLSKSKKEEREAGFSLIELLVVILIIGILAAIAIPVFLGQQEQAKQSAVKSDLSNAKIALVSCLADKAGDNTISCATAEDLATGDYGYSPSENVTDVDITIGTGSTFCMWATNGTGTTAEEGAKIFEVRESGGVVEVTAGCQ